MPCYNAAVTLDEALDSLFRQSMADFEIVAVNDGSEDDTQEKLGAWAARDNRLRGYAQPHGGIIAALNFGWQHCRGEYIARMDADDISYPHRLAQQAALLDSQPKLALASCLVESYPPGSLREGFRIYLEWLNALVTDEQIQRELYVESPLAHPSVMLRRDWLERAGGYQEHGWPEDYDLWLRLAQAGARFGKVRQVLLGWRDSPGRLTRQDERYSLENFLRAKAHYLMQGPLHDRQTVIIWGAGMMGRRLGKQLERLGAPLRYYLDIDPKKIGGTRRGCPVLPAECLPEVWRASPNPVVLMAVGMRGARALIRPRLNNFGLQEGHDWWAAA
jgi:glycosyltransferase involved in cell wall biosynthesis